MSVRIISGSNIEASKPDPEATIEVKLDETKSDYAKTIDPLTWKYQLPHQTNLLRPMNNHLLISPTGHSLNQLKNIHMHHNSPNIFLPWTLKRTLYFNFKDSGMPSVPPYTNPHQQKRSRLHTNISEQQIMVYLNLFSHPTPLQSQPQKNKTTKPSQEQLDFTFPRIELFIHRHQITHQTYHLHESWQRIWPSCCCCIYHESSTWRTWTQISRPCDFISPWRKGNPTSIPPLGSSRKKLIISF